MEPDHYPKDPNGVGMDPNSLNEQAAIESSKAQAYQHNFPSLLHKVGPTRSTFIANQCTLSPTHENVNMQFSKPDRRPVIADRITATRKLDCSSISGSRPTRVGWQVRNDLLSYFFTVPQRTKPRSFIPSARGRVSVPTANTPTFWNLNRPRHSYLKRKAMFNNKHYG